ncbi:MAG: trypsin-like peptidase domain-containing protein [Saprospiraceae bacterium]|nr:trypsin-like peptidase domain-containing protein [Saprospiraceae bacterium]
MIASEKYINLMSQYFSPMAENKAALINLIREEAADGTHRLEFYEVAALFREEHARRGSAPGSSDAYLAKMEENMQSVVMVLEAKALEVIPGKPGVFRVRSAPLGSRELGNGIKMCPNTAYARQHSADAFGTGFFVKPNVIATAAHVLLLSRVALEDIRFVHGICIQQPGDYRNGIEVSESQVYKLAPLNNHKLSAAQYYFSDMGSDFAVVKVVPVNPNAQATSVRPVVLPTDIKAYNALFRTKEIKEKQVYSIGHGLSLPMKVSYEGDIIHAPKTYPYFECNLALLGGNSGSPVFDSETHELLGIYIRGTRKLEMKPGTNCLDVKPEQKIPNPKSGDGQECQRLEVVWEAIQRI